MHFKLGWLPDPLDTRDEYYRATYFNCNKLRAQPAASRFELGEVLDQGNLGSCVAQAVAKLVYYAHLKNGVSNPEHLSRLALYYLCRAYHHMESWDSGTHIRTAFKVLNRLGFCPESEWPYNDDLGIDAPFRDMPPVNTFRMSFDQSNPGGKPIIYRKILDSGNNRIEMVKMALDSGYPVAFGTLVTEDFANNHLTSDPVQIPTSEIIAGGHAMVLAGYNSVERYFDVLNSWGTGFGDNGWCKMSFDYIAWDQTRDLTLVEVAPSFGVDS